MLKILTDPLIRRFLSGLLFAVAFVWLAIYFFEVEIEVVKVLAIFSVFFVLALISLAFVFSFLVKYLRPARRGMLDDIEVLEEEIDQQARDKSS